jgi:hypothetical protein
MARRLEAIDILSIWETALCRRPLDRAIAMLWSDGAAGDIAAWPLAERDRRLLELRRATFGDTLTTLADCPECGAKLELELAVSELAAAVAAAGPEKIAAAGHELTLRELTSHDLAALADVPAADLPRAMRERLTGVDTESFPPSLIDQIDARIEARETGMEITIRLVCDECDAVWTEALDIAACLWTEIAAAATRIMTEIAEIAAAFSWSEADILAMSETRRLTYLTLAGTP